LRRETRRHEGHGAPGLVLSAMTVMPTEENSCFRTRKPTRRRSFHMPQTPFPTVGKGFAPFQKIPASHHKLHRNCGRANIISALTQERFIPAFARDSLQSGVKYIRDYASGTIDEIDRMILHQAGAENLKFIETPYLENRLKEIRATRLGLKRYGKPPSPQMPGVQAMMLFEEAFDMLKRGYGVLQAQQGQAAQTGSIKKTSKVTKPVNPIPSPQPQSPSIRTLIRRILRKR